jgi:hypothetical protein
MKALWIIVFAGAIAAIWLSWGASAFQAEGQLATPPLTFEPSIAPRPEQAATASPRTPLLELIKHVPFREYGNDKSSCEDGWVRNVSSTPLRGVRVFVVTLTADGTILTTGEAPIKWDPLLPEQISPFEVHPPNHPSIADCAFSFGYRSGQVIPHRTGPSI